ncbi:phage portal protein [Staphylococcus aureus]|uniref:phage portal protein n=2 Tax=Staphylococcus aureus TaxID=1280 RepID=UPI00046C63D4|nr:phage portal protein [Staphylococcus aureus]WQJ26523.1 phage portal protein [Staphylococcus aureus]WQJ29190.1 phage portal protein [Staphylococcus aureus]WQJ60142.1 phage portal protein [Staphylococcus aureus]WQJ67855.1 phage portal protein [Staphylococcus aureus]WQK28783.1 phage portal protein [Staphylococcus aureus]
MINIIRMPWDKPYGEEIIEQMKPKVETQEEMIIRLINNHKQKLKDINVGQKYYDKDNDINYQAYKQDLHGNIDYIKPDWRITTNFHQNLVDQKVSYVASKPVTYAHDDDKVLDVIHQILDTRWDNKLIDILTAASNKGIDWLQVYINEDGELKLFRVPAEQAIPIWTDKEREQLNAFIRIFTFNDETKVEYWTAETVTYYVYENGSLIPDFYYGNDHIQTHFSTGSWERVPFIAFKNNPEEVSDIWMYKSFIDAIDKRLSDVQNMFDESVELIYILRGYEGEDLSEFMEGLKYYKAINVSSDGGVETIQVEVPVASTKEYLDMMRAYIVEFGQGVDFQTDKFGSATSGIALKFLYTNLNLKANKLKNKANVALQELIQFILDFNKIKLDAKEIEITFNFNVMVNDLEQSQIGAQSQYLSKETLVRHHPWVDDPKAELERLDEEQLELNKQLPNLDDGGADVGQQQRQSENNQSK